MSRGKPVQQKQVDHTREIRGLAALALAIFLGVTYYLPGVSTGALGEFFLRIGKGLVGPLAYVLPLLLVYVAVESWLEYRQKISRSRIAHVFVFALLVTMLLHLITVPAGTIQALAREGTPKASHLFTLLWKISYDPGTARQLEGSLPGGVICGLLAGSLSALAGKIGAFILVIVGLLVEAVVLFNLSFTKALTKTKEVIGRTRSHFAELDRAESEWALNDEGMYADPYGAAAVPPVVPAESLTENGRQDLLPRLDADRVREEQEKLARKPQPVLAQSPEERARASAADEILAPSEPAAGPKLAKQPDFPIHTSLPRYEVPDFLVDSLNRSQPNRRNTVPTLADMKPAQSSPPATDEEIPWDDTEEAPVWDGPVSTAVPETEDEGEWTEELLPVEHPVPIEKILLEDQTWNEAAEAETEDTDEWQEGMELFPKPRRVRFPGMDGRVAPPEEAAEEPAGFTPVLPQPNAPATVSPARSLAEAGAAAGVSGVSAVSPKAAAPAAIPSAKSQAAAAKADEASEGEAHEPRVIPVQKPYEFPPISLLKPEPHSGAANRESKIRELAARLEQTLHDFGVKARVINVTHGPAITRFELSPEAGVKVSKIVGLSDDIALSLAAVSVRIEAPIPGKSAIGIEIPNRETQLVGLRELIEDSRFKTADSALTVALGRDIPGQPVLCDLRKMPHLMVAGATGSGKSVCINCILISLLYRAHPKDVKLLLIDPKVVELKVYNGIPHLLAPVVTDPKKAANTLNWAVNEMDRRYRMFSEHGQREYSGYRKLAQEQGLEELPLIVLIIDELSDLMATCPNEVENSIARLTAMARAAGIHLIIATQRPSVDVITGVIKANIPSRIAFAVSSQVDSRTILDQSGAEKLLGKGDMLYNPLNQSKPIRAQGAFVSDAEVESVISFLKAQNYGEYDKLVAEQILSAQSAAGPGGKSEEDQDELLPQAVEVILDAGYASVSILQRRMNIGYPRAARLIDAMEQAGYIGPFEGSKPRKVRITRAQWEAAKDEGGVS